jgi:hypothetical protein
MEKAKEKLLIALYNVDRSYPEFVEAVECYAAKKPARMELVQRFLEENPRANSSDVLEFISMQPDFMEDVALSDAV